eukprot:scaffold4083_cov95-Cylindrotheca_fusiformis.AAC.1
MNNNRSNGISLLGALLGLVLALVRPSHAYYPPEVNPRSFAEGDDVRLFVNKMTSTRTLLPIEYYHLPYCKPVGGPASLHENLGELLAGDRMQTSPYVLRMNEEKYCQPLCVANLGEKEQGGTKPNKFVNAIRKEYHNNWIVDNLSSVSRVEKGATVIVNYSGGFPIGFIGRDGKAYVHNHVSIEIMYHPVREKDTEKYRVVRFTVQPFSIKHEFEEQEGYTGDDDDVPRAEPEVTIKNPIDSCNKDIPLAHRQHTLYDMVTKKGRDPQEASGRVLFTYDVEWVQNDAVHWASRWDVYLDSRNDFIGLEFFYWISVAIGLIIASYLSASIIAILVMNLRQDRYSSVSEDDEMNTIVVGVGKEEQVRESENADAGQPLPGASRSGAQLLFVTFSTIVLFCLGLDDPERSSFLLAVLMFFALMGVVAGFATGCCMYRSIGEARHYATLSTALGFLILCGIMHDFSPPPSLYWIFVAIGLIFVAYPSASIIAILVKNLRPDRCDLISDDELKLVGAGNEEQVWKLLHADVFRPPSFSPLQLSVACGSGAQLLCTAFSVIVLACLRFLSPTRRGSLLMAVLILYALMGIAGGFVTARMYKTFNGEARNSATLCTALGFPGLCFLMYCIVYAWCRGTSTYAPDMVLLHLLLLWIGLLTPLVFCGAYVGYKQDAIEFPVKTSNTPRQIPHQPWYRTAPFTVMISGIPPFANWIILLPRILGSFYSGGIFLLIFFIWISTSAGVAVVRNYWQLCNEDYHWWWRSFGTAGSSAICIFLYSIFNFLQTAAGYDSYTAYFLHFGFMGLACLGLFLMTGFVGVTSSLLFNKTLFQAGDFD